MPSVRTEEDDMISYCLCTYKSTLTPEDAEHVYCPDHEDMPWREIVPDKDKKMLLFRSEDGGWEFFGPVIPVPYEEDDWS